MMARYVDPRGAGPIVELGPGTGVITQALLRRGVAPERLVLVEFDADFCRLLERRFPGVRVVQGDAYNLKDTLKDHIMAPLAAIVSSLPLLMKPETQRLALLADAFALMEPEGRFIQFTYGPTSPMPRRKAVAPSFHSHASPRVWLNLPPARVWIYRQNQDGAAIAPSLRRPSRALEFLDRLNLRGDRQIAPRPARGERSKKTRRL
jgi:phosphatidylethanolamine/phosphatidyl-N-methylethanolamine N-methyltransferase